ncbi:MULTISPECIES: TetR/AcrR family transcriptional regulator [Bacteria]|uniref:TetR/AcrR family transcriptional regulator n=1 Tax=Bacteria TaxID=2 RepID=UPI003C7A77C8
MATTAREQAKLDRKESLVRAASALFAERGYASVSLEEIGAAVGVSGPAVYRHFTGKQALLGAVLVGVSERLVLDGRRVCADVADPGERMAALVRFHVDFALREPDVIRVQDRDVAHLGDEDRQRVRALQRNYIELWVDALEPLIEAAPPELRLRVQACFGLINSTPHSTRAAERSSTRTGSILAAMALAALRAS